MFGEDGEVDVVFDVVCVKWLWLVGFEWVDVYGFCVGWCCVLGW